MATFTFLNCGALDGTFKTFNCHSNEVAMRIAYTQSAAAFQVLNVAPDFTLTVVSRPVLDPPLLTLTNALLRWSAVSGLTYRVQHKASLRLTNWIDLIGDVMASETNVTNSDPTADGTANRFYRVRVVP